MNSSWRSSKVPVKTRFFYGWMVVFVAAMAMFFSGPGQTYSISIFIDAYINEFGWSRTFVSSMYSAATLVSGLLLFFVGRLVDRHGGRRMSIVIGLLLAAACIWNSFIISPVMLFLGFFFARYFGQGSMTLVPSTIVPQWFIKRRGIALSLMSLGAAAGSAFLPPFNTWLINSFSWNFAWRVWAVLICIIFVPLAAVFIRNTPEEVGLRPDNNGRAGNGGGHKEDEDQEDSWTLTEAMKTRSFWLVIFCIMIPSMVNTGLTFHMISIMGERGISAANSALVLSTIAVVAFPCTFLAGFVLDRVKVHYVLAVNFMGMFLSLFMLIYLGNFPMAIAYGVIRGLLQGFEAVIQNAVWPNYFGRRHLGSIRGFAMTALVIGSALGPLPFGAAFDQLGGYREVILVMALFPALGVISSLLAPKPKRPGIEAE